MILLLCVRHLIIRRVHFFHRVFYSERKPLSVVSLPIQLLQKLHVNKLKLNWLDLIQSIVLREHQAKCRYRSDLTAPDVTLNFPNRWTSGPIRQSFWADEITMGYQIKAQIVWKAEVSINLTCPSLQTILQGITLL